VAVTKQPWLSAESTPIFCYGTRRVAMRVSHQPSSQLICDP
jgi:hypothetical protein